MLMNRNFSFSNLFSLIAVSVLMTSMLLPISVTTLTSPLDMTKISPILMEKITLAGDNPINVIIETKTNDYSTITSTIENMGGTINYEYKYVNAIAASIPPDKLSKLITIDEIVKIYYDQERPLSSGKFNVDPNAFDTFKEEALFLKNNFETITATTEILTSLEPSTYWNPTAMAATPVWAEGYMGQGSLAVIIDTGIWAGHFMFAGTNIIGGVDLSFDVGTPYEGWSAPWNHYHGSHVAGILASTGGIIVPADDPLAVAIERYTGAPLPPGDPYGYPDTKIIWLLGMAPLAELYIIKIFDHTGAGVPEWKIMEAVEYAISLKIEKGYDVDIISMSIGGATLYDGRDPYDQLMDYATSVGITLVAAAGNEGPATMTISSPGSANTAITVGAAANPVNTRVFWEYYYGIPGVGYYLFTSETPQIYAFSGRGPTSDGRCKPTVSATGIFVLSALPSEANPQGLGFASGTSMATPAVSGAVALLNSYAEITLGEDLASPEDYKQAITQGAVWLEGYDTRDQGAGYLNAFNSLEALKADDSLGDAAPELPEWAWLEPIINVPIVVKGRYSTSVENLAPGHKVEFIFYVGHWTESIELTLSNVFLGEENPFGINSFEVYIQSAKRTMYAYFIDTANVWGDASFLITDFETVWTGEVTGVYWDPTTRLAPIEPGYIKIVIENDWTSYDEISADIEIVVKAKKPAKPDFSMVGCITEGETTDWVHVEVPEGTGKAIIELSWLFSWAAYPTNDLDLIVQWFNGTEWFVALEGATLNSPERVVLDNPVDIYVLVSGYTVYTCSDFYRLTVYFE